MIILKNASILALAIASNLFSVTASLANPDLTIELPEDEYCLIVALDPATNKQFNLYAHKSNLEAVIAQFDIVRVDCPQPSSTSNYLF